MHNFCYNQSQYLGIQLPSTQAAEGVYFGKHPNKVLPLIEPNDMYRAGYLKQSTKYVKSTPIYLKACCS